MEAAAVVGDMTIGVEGVVVVVGVAVQMTGEAGAGAAMEGAAGVVCSFVYALNGFSCLRKVGRGKYLRYSLPSLGPSDISLEKGILS